MSTLTKTKEAMKKKSSSVQLWDGYNQHRQNHWNRLDDATLETILAKLDIVDLFHCQKVCWRWKLTIQHSPTFTVPRQQQPWFIMFNDDSSLISGSDTGLVYDMRIRNWRHIDLLLPTSKFLSTNIKITPVASSGGYICFRCGFVSDSYSLIVTNPVTGSSRYLPKLKTFGHVRGISMYATKSGSESNYKVYVLFGDLPDSLVVKVYASSTSSLLVEDEHQEVAGGWMDLPVRKATGTKDKYTRGPSYGTPYQELVGVATLGNEGQILLNYLHEPTGRLICFDTRRGSYYMSRSFPEGCVKELVECRGLVFGVVLCEGVLYACKFDHESAKWQRDQMHYLIIEKMGPNSDPIEYTAMDIRCCGHGDYIMVCLDFEIPTAHFNKHLMINTKGFTCGYLPPYVKRYGRSCRPALAYPFTPDIHAKV